MENQEQVCALCDKSVRPSTVLTPEWAQDLCDSCRQVVVRKLGLEPNLLFLSRLNFLKEAVARIKAGAPAYTRSDFLEI